MDETITFLPELASVIVQCHRLSPQTATLDVAKTVFIKYFFFIFDFISSFSSFFL